MSDEEKRPLACLSAAEVQLSLEREKGEVWKEFTRLNETLKGLARDVDRTEKFKELALKLAADANDRHLVVLNDHAAKLLTAHTESSKVIVEAQAKLQSISAADRSRQELEARMVKSDDRIVELERFKERLWFPMIAASAIGVGIGAAAAKLLFP